jgi:hypothetical protein
MVGDVTIETKVRSLLKLNNENDTILLNDTRKVSELVPSRIFVLPFVITTELHLFKTIILTKTYLFEAQNLLGCTAVFLTDCRPDDGSSKYL